MRASSLAAIMLGCVLVLSPTAMAQQNQGGGLGDTIDRLNRAIIPDTNPTDQRPREDDRYQREQRSERESRDSAARNDRRGSSYQRYSDRDLREEYSRLDDEERQLRQERRALEDEMDRRGIGR